MSDAIITVEGLGKRYLLRHQRNERYTALRDVLADKARNIFRRNISASDSTREDFWALKDVSFEVKQGEAVGIIGRNGAGKSTLLKILSRITDPTEGRVRLRGRVASLLEVGTGFHPELTGRENIFLNGAILGMNRAEIKAKFDEIVAFAEVSKFLDTPVKRYSSGMYVRLAFAVAAHLEPDVLVIDEVLAVGDAAFQKKCLGKMSEVANRGRTVLFVSHNMAALQALCTKAVYLKAGQVQGIGCVRSLIAKYLTDSQASESPQLWRPVKLGDHLYVTRLELAPNPVESGSSLNASLEIRASEVLKLNDLAIIIWSDQGNRIGVLDFRSFGVPRALAIGETWGLSVLVKSLSLIEGEYRIGLYAACTGFDGTLRDLVSVSVTPRPVQSDFSPYPAIHRGFVEFEFTATSQS
jgi:lipopolysaccharide transport system ATP-binding protein